MTPLKYVYADAANRRVDAKGNLLTAADGTLVEGVLATTTGGMTKVTVPGENEGETVEQDSDEQLGLYHFANLPTAYVSENDQYYLAAYRIELADVEHTENDDKTDPAPLQC